MTSRRTSSDRSSAHDARQKGDLMAKYNIVPVADVPDRAAEVGMDPDHFEIRFLREPLALENFAVSLERFGCGWRPSRGHRHTVQEEVYFLVSGRAQAKLDAEVIDLEPWTAVRVPPETARAFRAAGAEDAVFVTIGAPQAGFEDVEFIQDFWTD
jgi:mannose-6-phosphate isomerase-like protein (cupin superfamily)